MTSDWPEMPSYQRIWPRPARFRRRYEKLEGCVRSRFARLVKEHGACWTWTNSTLTISTCSSGTRKKQEVVGAYRLAPIDQVRRLLHGLLVSVRP
jgi:hypothetical protein